MIIEGIITTENEDGTMHVSPIGPHVDRSLSVWMLKPFQSSSSFQNLRRQNRCVFHVVDNPLLMAASVLGLCNKLSSEIVEQTISSFASATSSIFAEALMATLDDIASASFDSNAGWLLRDASRVYALQITQWDTKESRAIAICSVIETHELRPFLGWCRASHSILELAIIASRLHIIERSVVESELERHRIIVEKTGEVREKAAWALLNWRIAQS